MNGETVETFYALVETVDPRQAEAAAKRGARPRFRVRYPDFPSLAASAPTVEQSTRLAHGVLREEIRQRISSTRSVPRPTSLQAIKDDPANRRAFALKVPVAVPDGFVSTRQEDAASPGRATPRGVGS